MRLKKVKVKEYQNAHGTLTAAHERNIRVSDEELENANRLAGGAELGIHNLKNTMAGLPDPTNTNYRSALKSIKKSVIDRGPVETASTILEKLDSLPGNSMEAPSIARECGAEYMYALLEHKKLFNETYVATGRRPKPGTAVDQSHNRLFEVEQKNLSPEQDAAFMQGVFYADPEGPNIVGRFRKDRILNFVQRDPEMIKTVENISRKYWKESFGNIRGFRNVKNFDDLSEEQKRAILGYHQDIAVASMTRNRLDNLNDVASGSLVNRIRMARFKRIKKKIDDLSDPSGKEQRLKKRASEMKNIYRSDMKEAADLQEKGLDTLTHLTKLSGYDASSEGRKSQKKASRIAENRKKKKRNLEDKISRMTSVPWWIRQGVRRSGTIF